MCTRCMLPWAGAQNSGEIVLATGLAPYSDLLSLIFRIITAGPGSTCRSSMAAVLRQLELIAVRMRAGLWHAQTGIT